MSPFGAQRAFLEAETHFALYLARSAWAPQANKSKAQADVKDLSAQIHPSDGGSQLVLLLVYLHPVAPWRECIKDFGASF